MDTKAEKKNRLSRLLGKRDKSPNPGVTPSPAVLPDSAYASSENPGGETPATITPDIVPVEKNSEIGNIDQDRNLAVKPSTGEVLDQDTGEIVTVVTTTTTTTTTTTRKPGQRPDVRKDVKEEVTETRPNIVAANSVPSEMPANNTVPLSNVPNRTTSRPSNDSPPLPTRSLARKSGEYANRQSQASTYPAYDENMPPPTGGYYGSGATDPTPVSPINPNNPNFSYPARNRNSGDPEPSISGLSMTDRPQHHSKSTMSDLRAAAKGIHGVGETLRGTLNSTIDERFPRKNPTKAAYASAKNEETLARGRSEMEHIPSRGNQPLYARTATNEQTVPGSWSENDPPATDHLTPIENQQEEKRSRSIGKLFKRKPVGGGQEGESRERRHY